MEDIGSRLGSSIVDRVHGARTRSIAENEYEKGQKVGWLKASLVVGPLSFVAGMVLVIAIVYG